MKRFLWLGVFLGVSLAPAAVLAYLTLVPAADSSAPLPVFHFYIVTFTTFSAAVVSILLAASLGNDAQPRHVLAAAAFAVVGSIFFSHGLATPNALIDHLHPALTWSAWLTLLGGGALFACAGLDGPGGPPRRLPVRLIVNTAATGVLLYSAVAAFLPDALDAIQKQAAPWTQWMIFLITLALWTFATLRLGWIWRSSRNAVDGALTFVSFWMLTATVSMHRYAIWNYSWWLYHVTLLLGFLITMAVLVRQYEQARQFRLQRYFLGLSLIITALLALIASALFTQFSYNTLVAEMQSSSAALADNLAGGIAHDLPTLAKPDDLRQLSGQPGLDAIIDGRLVGLPIQSVLLYDDKGVADYASDDDWTGASVQNRALFQAALSGQTVATILPPETPPATYRPSAKVDIVETYAPVRPGGDAHAGPIGVLVTVAEAPELGRATLNARVTGLLTAAVSMGLLFLALFTVVSRADAILTNRSAELARAYTDLREAEAMRDDLTNMIVHDLRSPLTAISASLDLMGRFNSEPQAAARSRMVNTAQSASRRMMLMIEDLLTVSKIKSGQFDLHPAPANICDLLTGAVGTFTVQAAAEQKALSLDCPSGLTGVFDPPLLRRVVENLIANALKYTVAAQGRIQVLAGQAGGRLTITVRDNGQGVPDDHKQRIFEKFVQLNDNANGASVRKGVGLGLAFCRLVVRQHGGQIAVSDAPGGGSDFAFWIPTAK